MCILETLIRLCSSSVVFFNDHSAHVNWILNWINTLENCLIQVHCVKSVQIRNFSCLYFASFGLNTERYKVSLRIQTECGKIQTRRNSVFGHISHSGCYHALKYILRFFILKQNKHSIVFCWGFPFHIFFSVKENNFYRRFPFSFSSKKIQANGYEKLCSCNKTTFSFVF